MLRMKLFSNGMNVSGYSLMLLLSTLSIILGTSLLSSSKAEEGHGRYHRWNSFDDSWNWSSRRRHARSLAHRRHKKQDMETVKPWPKRPVQIAYPCWSGTRVRVEVNGPPFAAFGELECRTIVVLTR
jgi:hypothetical protein